MTIRQSLQYYVEDFKKWYKANYNEQQIEENLMDDPSYSNWIELENFFSVLLESGNISKLDKEDKINLLYLIARGWDCGGLLYDSEEMPISTYGELPEKDFIDLAKTALTVHGIQYEDAKWLIAYCFMKFNNLTIEMEDILLAFYQDQNEYTKRMALFSLAKLGYKHIISLIEKSWTIDDEWHKIGCLTVLDKYVEDKSILRKFLLDASGDSKEDLADYVLELKQKNNI